MLYMVASQFQLITDCHFFVVVMAPKLNTSSPTNETILAVWAPVEHAVLYTLVIIREGSYVRNKLNTTNTEVTFDNLQSGTSYCIKSMAWDAEGRIGDDKTVCQITRKHQSSSAPSYNFPVDSPLVSSPGPSSPDVIDIQVTQGRAPGIAIYWVSVQGAKNYTAWTTSGQNCSTGNTNCYILLAECGQNRSVYVTASNEAGISSPSQSVNYITCGFGTLNHTLKKCLKFF